MNKYLLSTAVLFVALVAQADERSRAYNACEAEAKSVFGDDASVRLRGIRDQLKGFKMKLKISNADAGTRTVTCIYREGKASVVDSRQPVPAPGSGDAISRR